MPSRKEEYEADAIAYNIVLKIIMEENTVLEKYTYLAPMMYMDFLIYIIIQIGYYMILFVLIFSILFRQMRKDYLFTIVDREEYDFDTVDGNHLYSGF